MKGPTVFSQLVTMLDVGERARGLVLSDPVRAVRFVAPTLVDLYGPELGKLTVDEWANLERFLTTLLADVRGRVRTG